MRVLQVIDSLAPGGAERSLVATAPLLRRLDVQLSVATFRTGTLAGALASAGIPVRVVGGESRRVRLRRLADLFRAEAPDLVHTTLFEADVVGRLAARHARIPVVSSLVSTPYGPDHVGQPGIRVTRLRGAQALDLLTARQVVRFHAVSQIVASTMASRLRIPPHRIDVVVRGRDAAALGRRTTRRRDSARSALGLGRDAPLVVMLARHEYAKGIDVAIEATARIRARGVDAVLAVAGGAGNHSAALATLMTDLGLGDAVRLLGPRDDVAELLCAADVFLAPSRREGLPGSVLEAMALEVPIVASDIPPMREVLNDDSQALFTPVDDPASVAVAVLRSLRHDGEARRRAEAARQRFCDFFTVERSADGMAAFYRRALEAATR